MLGTFGLCRKWRSTTRYDYVTKRPKDIQALRFSADEHGQFAVAGDVGGFLGEDHQFGYRINLVNEQIDSYVDHVDGERYLAALALDWKATAQSKFEFDLEAQRSEQKSVPGYQLLDGKVPQNVKWERLLGYQSWGKPVTIDSLNTSLKYNYAFNDDWNLGLVASHSKSKVDDYSVFPFGYYRDGCEAAYSCNTFSAQVIKTRDTDLDKFLPQFAVSYSPSESTTLYASYAKGLSDGKTAPWFVENSAETLAPIHSEQYEIGLKQQIHNFLLTAAIFDLRQDNQYSKPILDKRYFVQEGEQRSLGLELGLNGELTDHLALSSSLALTKARLDEVEAVEYGNHQAQNVPKVRFATHLTYQVPNIEGLRVLAGGQYSSSKYANKQGTAKVSGYSVFDLGAAYQFKLNTTDAQLRFNINNLLNKKYWRDAGEFYGDDYLFLGAPRTATLSLNLNF